MSNMVLDLQQELLLKDCDIIQILRKAHLLALRNGYTEFDAWLQFELNGYSGHMKDIPSYRRITGNVKAKNPLGKWVPVVKENGIRDEELSTRPLHHDLPTLVELYEKAGNHEIYFSYPAEKIQDTLDENLLGLPSDMALFVQPSQIKSIIEAVKNTLLEWLIKAEKIGDEDMDKKSQPKLFALVDAIPKIRKSFKVTDIKGFPRVESIYSEQPFIEWSEEVKNELRKLKQDELTKEIFDLFSKFTGWTDKKLFDAIAAKLKVLKDNYDDYLLDTNEVTAAPQSPVQSVTNNYFLGSISGSNISTGNNAEQELENTQPEEKSWMEKYGIQIVVALISVAGAIIAAIIGLG